MLAEVAIGAGGDEVRFIVTPARRYRRHMVNVQDDGWRGTAAVLAGEVVALKDSKAQP